MSYSFSVAADTKAEAKVQIAAEFDRIVSTQPIHAADREVAQGAAESFVDLVSEPAENQTLVVNVHGSVSWLNEDDFQGANVGIGVQIVAKAQE